MNWDGSRDQKTKRRQSARKQSLVSPLAPGKKKRRAGEEKRYADINRAVNEEEMSVVMRAGREAGLWRFQEAARHDGFNI